MPHANNIWLFLPATLTLNLTPGPDMLATVNAVVALAASYTGARLKAYLKDMSAFRWLSGGLFIGPGIRLATLQ